MSWGHRRVSIKTSKAQSIQVEMDKPDFIKIKNFPSLKDTAQQKMKREVTENIANYIFDEGFVFRIYEEISKLVPVKTIQLQNENKRF